MHLSNYSINKHSDEYVQDSSDEATKRKLSDIYQNLKTGSPNGSEIVKKIKESIKDVCMKTLSAIHADIGKALSQYT